MDHTQAHLTYEEARAFCKMASKRGSVLGLAGIKRLMGELSNVQEHLPIIHIAGTNGKGSVGAYLSAVFQKAGLCVGRYCSPAVFDPLEVWQYNGRYITEEEYAKTMSQVKSACDILLSKGYECPTVFEIETAAAFVWLYEKKTDVVLLEVGMGGETDATNVIAHPIASVITTISMDHMQFLGESLSQIAAAKAGIIKEGCPVFSAPQEASAAEVIRAAAERLHAPLTMLRKDDVRLISQQPGRLLMEYDSPDFGMLSLTTKLAGSCQLINAPLAAETALFVLRDLFRKVAAKKDVIPEHVKKAGSSREKTYVCEGIADAVWPGRFEVIGSDPLFIIDGAHNEDAAIRLCETVQNCFTNRSLTYIIGVLADKEHKKMLMTMLPHADAVYTVTPDNARALSAEALRDEAAMFCGNVTSCASVSEAVASAISHAKAAGTPILAFGSLSYLSGVKAAYESIGSVRWMEIQDDR